MSRLLAYLGRLLLILFAYVVAALAASAFLHALALGGLGWSGDELPAVLAGSILFSVPFVALFVAYFAFIPAAFAIGVGELLGARDWLYYAIAGGLSGAAVIGLFWTSAPFTSEFDEFVVTGPNLQPLDDPRYVLAIIGAGMIGGVTYWLSAGRSAGSWRAIRRSPTSPAP